MTDGSIGESLRFAVVTTAPKGRAVGGINYRMEFVAEGPFCTALLGPGAVLRRPRRLGVADVFPVGVGVSTDHGRVHGHLLVQVGQQLLEFPRHLGKAGFHEVGVMREPSDESVERTPVRQDVAKAAERAEVPIFSEPPNQSIGVRQVEDERCDVGAPEGSEAITWGSVEPGLPHPR